MKPSHQKVTGRAPAKLALDLGDSGSDARVSPCGRYRYTLERRWSPAAPLLWIMLNPSTADARLDDPTIRRCIRFARTWGHGGITVVNLFALRATDPRALRFDADPIGPENDEAIVEALNAHEHCVAAWGAHADPRRVRSVALLAEDAVRALWCLGTTREGAPRHPLYVRGDTKLAPWSGT